MSIQEIIDVASKYKAATAVGLLIGGFFVSILIGAANAFTAKGEVHEPPPNIPARVKSLEARTLNLEQRVEQRAARDSARFDKLERIGCEPLDAGQRYKLGCPK